MSSWRIICRPIPAFPVKLSIGAIENKFGTPIENSFFENNNVEPKKRRTEPCYQF